MRTVGEQGCDLKGILLYQHIPNYLRINILPLKKYPFRFRKPKLTVFNSGKIDESKGQSTIRARFRNVPFRTFDRIADDSFFLRGPICIGPNGNKKVLFAFKLCVGRKSQSPTEFIASSIKVVPCALFYCLGFNGA